MREEIFTDLHFLKYRNFIFDKFGVYFNESKKIQLETKVRKAMARKGCSSFERYLALLQEGKDLELLQEFIDIITTNTTEFFREKEHFDFITKNIPDKYKNKFKLDPQIRVWCAACSTGQEPLSIAITLLECLDERIRIKILATDINEEVLKKAIEAKYSKDECKGIPDIYLMKYFDKIGFEYYRAKDALRELIVYRKYNLLEPHSFKNKFDIIFCRNVMIYFQKETQQKLIDKFYENLNVGGYFFTGHNESLINKVHSFKTVSPAVYIK